MLRQCSCFSHQVVCSSLRVDGACRSGQFINCGLKVCAYGMAEIRSSSAALFLRSPVSLLASSSTSPLVLSAMALCLSISSLGAVYVVGIFRFVLGISATAHWFWGRPSWGLCSRSSLCLWVSPSLSFFFL